MGNFTKREERKARLTTQVAAEGQREPAHSVERWCACGARAAWHVSGGKRPGFYCDEHRPEL